MLHGDLVEGARLQVHQKIALCRAMSTSDHNNKMWDLVSNLNTVRNALAHSLSQDRRSTAIQRLRTVYERELGNARDTVKGIPVGIEKDIPPDTALCLYAVAAVLGYLHAHLAEVRRLKTMVLKLDKAMNKGTLSS